jgi:hypothetical protein
MHAQLKLGDVVVIKCDDKMSELKILAADTTRKDRIRLSMVRTPLPTTRPALSQPNRPKEL